MSAECLSRRWRFWLLPAGPRAADDAADQGRPRLARRQCECPCRQILAEWARVGGTKIVGADKITGAPLTLHIVDMPERQALDIILRNVAGFMAAPRTASAARACRPTIAFSILATSSCPPQPASTAARSPPASNARCAPPAATAAKSSAVACDDAPDEPQQVNDESADTGLNQNQQPVFTFPAPPMVRARCSSRCRWACRSGVLVSRARPPR